MKKLLQILIPTLNREESLIRNLRNIQQYILDNDLSEKVGVIISDNGSTYDSYAKLYSFVKNYITIDVSCYHQNENIGIEQNILFLLDRAESEYVMTLGDDDYFTEQYLLISLSYLEKGNYTGIIPNFYLIDAKGEKINTFNYREPIQDDQIYDRKSLWISIRGHQLSCIIFKLEGVAESYRKNVHPNAYPFIYFIAYNLSRGKMILVTREPFACTMIPKKNWDYSFDNLMGDIACVIDALPYENKTEKMHQLQVMVRNEVKRFCNEETIKHPFRLFKQISRYECSRLTRLIIIEQYFMQRLRRIKWKIKEICTGRV